MDLTFSRTEACLTSLDSKTLGISIPKLELDIATADKVAKTNGVEINNEDVKQESNTNKNIMNKDNHNNRCDLLGKSLETGSLLEYSWRMFTRTKLLLYITKENDILHLLGWMTGVARDFELCLTKVLKKYCL